MGARGKISRSCRARLPRWWVGPVLLFVVLGSQPPLQAQSTVAAASTPKADQSELTSRETLPTFKLQVERNVVLVRVVVRDAKGKPVRGLKREDFRLFDNRKPQTILHFSVEEASSSVESGAKPGQPRETDTEALPESERPPSTPQRYTALYFDDVHLIFGDLVPTRDAAQRYLTAAIRASDRVAIVTSSGQGALDFTDDRDKLHEALSHLFPHPVVPIQQDPCPDISEYQAYEMVERRDPAALEIATQEVLQCRYQSDPRNYSLAQAEAETEAVRSLNLYETQADYALRGLDQLVRRMAALPGQRNIVLLSPGFLTLTKDLQKDEIADRALRSNVIINSLDAKGLYVILPLGEASHRPVILPTHAELTGNKAQIVITGQQRNSEVLRDLAMDTGGVYFHNSNNFDEGFRKVGALPEVYYVLGFSPQNLKLDGRFHTLKVTLASTTGLMVQARRGYFAPKKPQDASTQAKEEIEQAIFSQEDLRELPIEVHTQFFKTSESGARLSVLTHLDLHLMHFRKEEGRNLNDLTLVTALFDRDGKYVTAKEKRLELRLRDISLETLLKSGLNMKTSFDLKPGTYLVRQVVRDAEGGQLSGLSRAVEIPF